MNGADAVLLIVAALHDDELAELHERGARARPRLPRRGPRRARPRARAGARRRRDRDQQPQPRRPQRRRRTTHELMPDVPAGKTVVAESGYERREQIEELERIGVDAVLVGEALMRAGDPEARGSRADPRRGPRPASTSSSLAARRARSFSFALARFCRPFSGRLPNSLAMQRVKRVVALSARLGAARRPDRRRDLRCSRSPRAGSATTSSATLAPRPRSALRPRRR